MRLLRYILVAFAVLALAIGVVAEYRAFQWRRNLERVNVAAEKCYENHIRYAEWHRTSTIPFQSPISQEVWAKRYREITVGQHASDVLAVMGEPEFVEASISKEGDRFVGCAWTYFVRRNEESTNYKQDSWIDFFLDAAKGKIVDKDAVNVADIPNRPVPAPAE